MLCGGYETPSQLTQNRAGTSGVPEWARAARAARAVSTTVRLSHVGNPPGMAACVRRYSGRGSNLINKHAPNRCVRSVLRFARSPHLKMEMGALLTAGKLSSRRAVCRDAMRISATRAA